MRCCSPPCNQYEEAARRMKCANNLKQYGLGLQNYHDIHNAFPPGGTPRGQGPKISWQVRILPFTEQNAIYEQLDMRRNDVGRQRILINRRRLQARNIQVTYSQCPSDTSQSHFNKWAQTSYCGSLGSQLKLSNNTACNTWITPGLHFDQFRGFAEGGNTRSSGQISGLFNRVGTVRLIDIASVRDGTSNTICVGEIIGDCNGQKQGWWGVFGMGNAHASTSAPLNVFTTCALSEEEAARRGYINPFCHRLENWNYAFGFRSFHPNGANFLLCDGSVHFISSEIDYGTYQSLGGRNDGAIVGEY